MLYNIQKQDELEHTAIAEADKAKLYLSLSSLSLWNTSNSLNPDYSKLDSILRDKIYSEIVSNRKKNNPLRFMKEEKASSDFLFSNLNTLNLDTESTMKLLSYRESFLTQEKFSNFFLKNKIEQLLSFSEYFYYFSLMIRNGTLNEQEAFEETEKAVKNFNAKITENKELNEGYFKLIPILEQFNDINFDNFSLKLKFLKDIIPNIRPVIESSSDLILFKLNETFHYIFNKLEKNILDIEEKLNFVSVLNIEAKTDKNPISVDINRDENYKKHSEKLNSKQNHSSSEWDEGLKNQLSQIFSFMLLFSDCFKFSYGFFSLAKYLQKFNFEREFSQSIDFNKMRRISENELSTGGSTKAWQKVTLMTPGGATSYELVNDTGKPEKPGKIDPLAIFQYLPKISSHCKFGNNWFFYNNINGLVKLFYKEEQNKVFYVGRNTNAFDLQKGFILPIGNENSGLICFVPSSLFDKRDKEKNEKNADLAEARATSLISEQNKVQILLSDHIRFENKEMLDSYSLSLNEIFMSIRDWLEKTLYTFNEQDLENFVYTDKSIKIPNEHYDKTTKSEDIFELMSKVVFHASNNMIYCIRPILKIRKDKKIYKSYFSEKFIYAVDIFDLNIRDNSKLNNNQGSNLNQKVSEDESKNREEQIFSIKTIKHIKSCVLTNKNEKSLELLKKQNYTHLELFLDNLEAKNAFNNLMINAGKLIMFSSEKRVFVFDLLYNCFELTKDLPLTGSSTEEEYDACFLTKGNFIALLRIEKVEHYKIYYYDTFLTKLIETNLPLNFSVGQESLYYSITQMDNFYCDMDQEKQKELNNFLGLNFNMKNNFRRKLVKPENFKNEKEPEENNNLNKLENLSENLNSQKKEEISEKKGNALFYILSNLSIGASSKFNDKNYSDINSLLATSYFSYNDIKNFDILFELVMRNADQLLTNRKEESESNHKAMEQQAIVLISILNLLKLHVKNNSRLGWDFGIYFKSHEKLQQTLKFMFDFLGKLISFKSKILEKEYSNLSSENDKIKNILTVYEIIAFLLLEILFEIMAYNFTDKNYFVNLLSEFLIEIKINKSSGKTIMNDINTATSDLGHSYKSIFLGKLKLKILEGIENLFIKNSNYIIAFMANEYLRNFILEMFINHLESIKKKLLEKNPKSLINTYLLNENKIKLENENLKAELLFLNLEKVLTQIISSVIVKYIHSILNFGKKIYNQSLEIIIEEIFNCKKTDNEISIIKKSFSEFVIMVSNKFFETGILLSEFIGSSNLKTKLIKNNFVLININNILNFINLISFENFPEFIFSNWNLILNLLNKLSNLSVSGSRELNFKLKEDKENAAVYPVDTDYVESLNEKKRIKAFYDTKASSTNKNYEKNWKKFDIVVDNFNIDDTKQKTDSLIYVNLEDLITNKTDLEESNPTLLDEMCTNVYIYFMAYYPNGIIEKRKPNLIFHEKTKEGTDKKITYYLVEKGLEVEHYIIKNIPVKTKLGIGIKKLNYFESVEENSQPILYKLRISNYRFNDKVLWKFTSTLNEFMNKTIKFFSFYENSQSLINLRINEDVKKFVSSGAFSGGINELDRIIDADKNTNILMINKDLETFLFYLNPEIKKKLGFLSFEKNPFFKNNPGEPYINKGNPDSHGVGRKNPNGTENENYSFESFSKDFILNNISFEKLITINDIDFSELENLKIEESVEQHQLMNSEIKILYLFKKLFVLFDFLLEKINREYIIKGPLIDKIILGIFFICVKQDYFLNSLEKTLEGVFCGELNYSNFTSTNLKMEECLQLLENKNFEEIYYIWKNCCLIRKTFKAKKDLIFQQQDENYSGNKLDLNLKKTEIPFAEINCTLDPKKLEDVTILNYFECYLRKLKLIFYLKSDKITNHKNKKIASDSLEFTRTHSSEINDKSVIHKKNSLYLQNLVIKSIKENNFEDKKEQNNKQKARVKEFAGKIISAVTNEKIDVENIIACLYSVNLKIKFREVSVFIINEILKDYKNFEVKSELISNFYQNFKMSKQNINCLTNNHNHLPDIFDNLNTTSEEQADIINNLFHQYLKNILDELNSLFNDNVDKHRNKLLLENPSGLSYKTNKGDSNIYLLVLLNNLIWNIKGRNFNFLLESQFFQILFNNKKNSLLEIAKQGMFMNPSTFSYNESISICNSINNFYHVFSISVLLTDIFIIYSNSIIKRIIKEEMHKTRQLRPAAFETLIKAQSLEFTKSNSFLENLSNKELISNVIEIFNLIMEEFLEKVLYLKKEEFYNTVKATDIATLKNDLEDTEVLNFNNFLEYKLLMMYNVFFSQTKLWNICISLLKLFIIKDTSIDNAFKDVSFFSHLTLLLMFADEKNVYLILAILKNLVSHFNKNIEDFEFFVLKLKETYKTYILPFRQPTQDKKMLNSSRSKNINNSKKINSEDLLASLFKDADDLEKTNSIEFFLKFFLTLKINSSKLRFHKDLIFSEKEVFNLSNNIQNIIDVSIEQHIGEFIRYFINQSEFKSSSIKFLLSLSFKKNGMQIAKLLDSGIGYLSNFSKIICNAKLDFNSSNSDKSFDYMDVEGLVKKGTLVFHKGISFLDNKANVDRKKAYSEMKENTTEDCYVKAFLEDSTQIFSQIETNKPNLLFPFESECIMDEEYLEHHSILFVDKAIIEGLLEYVKVNLIQKQFYTLSHLQSYIRIFKFLKKLRLITEENLCAFIRLNNKNHYPNLNNLIEEDELIHQEEIKKLELLSHLDILKKTIEKFFADNKQFFECFLIFDNAKLPVNILNLSKLEHIFFSYTAFDIKMISTEKKEILLCFENPINRYYSDIPLFPLGKLPQNENDEQTVDTDINRKNLIRGQKTTIEEINKLYLNINFNENTFVFRLDRTCESYNTLNMEIYFVNYSHIFQEGGDSARKNNQQISLRKLKKPKYIEIFDAKKAQEILEENFEPDKENKKQDKESKKKHYAIFLSDEFLQLLDLKDPNKTDVNEYLENISSSSLICDLKAKGKKETDSVENNNENRISITEEELLLENNQIETGSAKGTEFNEQIIRNRLLFKKFLETNYDVFKCVIFINDEYFNHINKSDFNCFSIDYSMLEREICEFLMKPSLYSIKYKVGPDTLNHNTIYTSILFHLASDISRFSVTKEEDLRELKHEIKLFSEAKEKNKIEDEISKKDNENKNKKKKNGLFDSYLDLIGLSILEKTNLKDINVFEAKSFGYIYNFTETTPFINQEEIDIKNLGMHILKQHLRFLCINCVSDYSIWQTSTAKCESDINSREYDNLFKYLKVLYYQSSFKRNFFNLKLEYRFIFEILSFMVTKIFSSCDSENVKILFNSKPRKFISLADSVNNENDLAESLQYQFISQTFEILSEKGHEIDSFSNFNFHKNLTKLCEILLNYLQDDIREGSTNKIIYKLKILSSFIDIIKDIVQKTKKNIVVNEAFKEFLVNISMQLLTNESLRTLMGVKSKKKSFSFKILEFVLNLLSMLFAINNMIDSKELSQQINSSIDKKFIEIHESKDIIQNKFKCKRLLEKVIIESEELQNSLTKRFRMPNIKNSFCFTIGENKFKKFDLNFQNAEEKQNESIVLCELSIKKKIENLPEKDNENLKTQIHSEKKCDEDDNLRVNYNLTTCLGHSELYYNLTSAGICNLQSSEEEIKKTLIYSDNISNMLPKNYIIAKENKESSKTTIYNLPADISNTYCFREDRALVMQRGTKLLCQGYIEKLYPYLSENELITEISKTENILKTFDNGIIITDKHIHVLAYIQGSLISSEYIKSEGYLKFPINPITDPKSICWAHVEEYGVVLVDTEGQIYSVGKYYFGSENSTTFEINKHLVHNKVFGNKKCRMAYVSYEASLYLIEEEDGRKYLYGSGYNSNNIGLQPSNNHYILTTARNEALANVPLKKLLVSRCNVICVSEANELYYCGFQRDYNFSLTNRVFYVPKVWEWPKQNNYVLLDAFKSSKDTFFVMLRHMESGRSELFMFGQAYLFNDGKEKFIWYDKDPFKVDLNNLVDVNIRKIQEERELKLKLEIENNKQEELIEETKENCGKEEKNLSKKKSVNLIEIDEGLIDVLDISEEMEEENEFFVSRYFLNDKANYEEFILQNREKGEAKKTSDSDDNNGNNDKNKETKGESKLNTEYGYEGLTTELVNKSYRVKEVKVMQHNESTLKIAAILGHEPQKQTYDLSIMNVKYNYNNSPLIKKEDSSNNYCSLNTKHAVCVIKNMNNFMNEFNLTELTNNFSYLLISVLENPESVLISPIAIETKQDLIGKIGENLKEKIDEMETNLNNKSIQDCNFKNAFEYLENSTILSNIDLEPDSFLYIRSNFNEILNVLLIADNFIINKNKLNENYFEEDDNTSIIKDLNKQGKMNLKSKSNKHSIFSIKFPNDNIEKICPEIYEKAKNAVFDNYIKNLPNKALKEYCESKITFSQQNPEAKNNFSKFSENILQLNNNSQKFSGYFNNKNKINFIEKGMSLLEQSILCLIDIFNPEESKSTLYQLILENLFLLSREFKEKAIDQEIAKLKLNQDRREISINRMTARTFENLSLIDRKFEHTIFSQVYRECKKFDVKDFHKSKNYLLFRVDLKGENAADAGGPAREVFTQIFEDLMSKRIDLFIPTPNQQAASGFGRDLWTINPAAKSIYHLDCFEFIGKVFAYSIISKVYCPIYLPRYVWKLIFKLNLQPEDLEEIDTLAYNSIIKPCLYKDLYKEEFRMLLDYTCFTAALSNGEEIDLIEGGKFVHVKEDNYNKFIELYLEARYREAKEQADAIFKGISAILNPKILIYMSPDDLAERIAGPLTFNLELFKENTNLVGYEKDDPVIGYFWKFIENCTLEERVQYLKFCWGRTTLPNSSYNWDEKHTINNIDLSETSLPISHTCFFSIDLPNYPDYETLKQKLTYAMNHSYIISDGSSLELDI